MKAVRVYIVTGKHKRDKNRKPLRGFLTSTSAKLYKSKSKNRKVEKEIEVVW